MCQGQREIAGSCFIWIPVLGNKKIQQFKQETGLIVLNSSFPWMEKQHAASLSASACSINEGMKKNFKSLRFGLAEADTEAVADLIKLIFSEHMIYKL